MFSWLYFMLITSTIPSTPMPYIPSVGNELSTTGAFAYPPIATLGGAALSTVIPVVLTVLRNIKSSCGSLRLCTFCWVEFGSSVWQACFDNASHSLFCARGIQHRFISHPQLCRWASSAFASLAVERYSPLRMRHLPLSWLITRLESPWMVTRPGGRGARYFNTWRTPAYSATLLDMVLPFPTKPYSFKRTVLLPSLTTTPN